MFLQGADGLIEIGVIATFHDYYLADHLLGREHAENQHQ
jgi:hypothetical protein